jgi:serine/threonine protein kinase
LQKWEVFEVVDIDGVKPNDIVVFECRRERHVKNFNRNFNAGRRAAIFYTTRLLFCENLLFFRSGAMDMTGKTVSHYKLLEKLGQGGMGVVYKAQDTLLLRLVAVKFLSPSLVVDEESRQRFLREARAASALNHPNICTVYGVGQLESALFIVMEYIDGRTLRDVLKQRGALPESEVAAIALQICSALAATHAAGIIHRDVKPDNIMRRADGQVKIMDFGLAKLIESGAQQENFTKPAISSAPAFDSVRTSSSSFEGTALYMAPEQIQKGPVDARADVYALGILMYELLTGQPPFQGQDCLTLMAAIVKEKPKPPSSVRPGISSAMEAAVLQCLGKSPQTRPQNMEVLSRMLSAIASPPNRTKRKPFARMSVLSAVLLAMLALVLYFAKLRHSASVPQLKLKALSLTGIRAEAPDFSPDGKWIAYVAAKSDDDIPRKLLVQDLDGGQTKTLFDSYFDQGGRQRNPGGPDWSPDGRWIAFHYRDGGISVVDTAGQNFRQMTAFGYNPQWSPDGKRIAFAELPAGMISEKSAIWIFDLADSTLKPISPANDLHFALPSWSPNGRWIVCSAGFGSKSDLWLIEASTDQTKRILRFETGIPQPRWSGRFIYFAGQASEHYSEPVLWRVEVNSHAGTLVSAPVQVLTDTRVSMFNLSADGKKLVYSTSAIDEKLWKIPMEAGRENPWEAAVLLESHTKGTGNLDVSPDGKTLVFETFHGILRDLVLLSLEDRSQTLLYDRQPAFAPAWSPDGRWIAFDAGGGNEADIWRVPTSGGAAEKIIAHPGADWMPTYSPDGQKICFLSNRGGQFDLWVYAMETGDSERITHTPETESGGYWSHDGNRLAFFRNDPNESSAGIWIYRFDTCSEQEVFRFAGVQIDVLTKILWREDDGALYFCRKTHTGEGDKFTELILDTRAIRHPLDVDGHQTPDVFYTMNKSQLFLLERKFHSRLWLAEGLE